MGLDYYILTPVAESIISIFEEFLLYTNPVWEDEEKPEIKEEKQPGIPYLGPTMIVMSIESQDIERTVAAMNKYFPGLDPLIRRLQREAPEWIDEFIYRVYEEHDYLKRDEATEKKLELIRERQKKYRRHHCIPQHLPSHHVFAFSPFYQIVTQERIAAYREYAIARIEEQRKKDPNYAPSYETTSYWFKLFLVRTIGPKWVFFFMDLYRDYITKGLFNFLSWLWQTTKYGSFFCLLQFHSVFTNYVDPFIMTVFDYEKWFDIIQTCIYFIFYLTYWSLCVVNLFGKSIYDASIDWYQRFNELDKTESLLIRVVAWMTFDPDVNPTMNDGEKEIDAEQEFNQIVRPELRHLRRAKQKLIAREVAKNQKKNLLDTKQQEKTALEERNRHISWTKHELENADDKWLLNQLLKYETLKSNILDIINNYFFDEETTEWGFITSDSADDFRKYTKRQIEIMVLNGKRIPEKEWETSYKPGVEILLFAFYSLALFCWTFLTFGFLYVFINYFTWRNYVKFSYYLSYYLHYYFNLSALLIHEFIIFVKLSLHLNW